MSQWDALHHKDVFPGAAAVPALPCKAWALLEHCSGALSFCGQESGQGQQGCTGRPSVTRGGAGALCRELLVEEPGRASLAASRGLPASDMEGCWTVTISSELVYTFPTLLHLSAEEIVAIWDAVSDYILEQMKLDKGVLVPGLGLFAAVREQFHSKEVAVSVRRPVFQLDIGVLWLQDLQSPTDIIPDDVKIERLNYRQLSRATGISLHVVQRCVRETVLLYCHLLRNKAHVSFAFKNIGVMTYEDDFLCMRFLSSCITTLESNASLTALLHTRIWPARSADFGSETTAHGIQVLPRFQLAVKKSRAEAAAERNAAVARKMSRGGTAGRLLQKRKTLPPSMLLQYQAGSRQQDVAKKPSASVLPPCAGSSHGRKQAGQKEPSTPAQTSTALPATEDSKRVLQELREVSALWNEADRTWPVYQQQVEQTRAERAAWEGWSAGEDQPPLQRFASASVWAPRPPAQPRGQQVRRRWRKDVDPPPGSKMGNSDQAGTACRPPLPASSSGAPKVGAPPPSARGFC
ncbi:coiled-coil domain-containing protein 81-like isoform X4 [Gallus gallus]|uniref:coiled-coil domain-containing protein 81-like isoform X4 n=1 Tax=Gallus gallus TaxID=9031 RepID=UPI001F00D38B|nr:coiled-coil domain-containing protein 81-like isoform X4 [Gallus gallus]